MFSESIFTSSYNEKEWIVELKDILEKNKEAKEVLVSVFEVPEALRSVNPVAYAPQMLAFGPYHHFRPKLYQMQRFKVAAAMRAQKDWLKVDFEQLFAQIGTLVSNIRTCYQTHLYIQDDTLAWLLAIDGLALLKVIHSSLYYYNNYLANSPWTNPFGDFSERNPDLDMVIRDMLMLETQIPMIVLTTISENCHDGFDRLKSYIDFIEAISPLQLPAASKVSASDVVNYKHLLDLFYQLICPKQDGINSNFQKFDEIQSDENLGNSSPPPDCNVFTRFLGSVSNFQFQFAALPEKVLNLIFTSLQLLGISTHDFFDKDRACIATASQLVKTGVKFSICEGIRDIKFDNQTLELPVITLNSKPNLGKLLSSKLTSEVILRNLVAFESLSKDRSESLPFTRYTQLMNGIIGNDEDVNLLKNSDIIKGDLASVEIAKLFNNLSETIQPKDRDINIDEAITKINSYYDNTMRVRTNKLMKKYIYSSWKFLTVLATFLLLGMLFLETFCGFYACHTVRFKA
ncbi:hypothetical protein CCACVL1_00261 [Corchorus capsularis]|uniref:Uncharacterized protein n=1 Tax=Corchorus capsularis TaxID=210143 RepID=A0A1R3KXG1_COCAP|nr:hypothetical protein CCACVL1_00261 [Corchorus capsularis]